MQVVLIKNMIRTVFIVGNNVKQLEVFHPLLKIGFFYVAIQVNGLLFLII